MKKMIATAASLALAASAAFASPAVAQDGGQSEYNKAVVDFCKNLDQDEFPYSVGECVRVFHTDGSVDICNQLKVLDLLEAFGYRNVGQCIKAGDFG